jgi:hypothetical protein
MRKYTDNDERSIRTTQLVRDWTRSKLVDQTQADRMLSELHLDLKRTNVFFRLMLLGFGLLIIWSAVALIALLFGVKDEKAIGMLCLGIGVGSYSLAEYLITRFHFYRFGVEEAAAMASVPLIAVAAGLLVSSTHFVVGIEFPIFFALVMMAAAAFAIYRRLGYIYAAIVSMICAGLAPFASDWSPITHRSVCAAFFSLVFLVARSMRRKHGDEFPADEYSVIEAMAWCGLYISFNVHLSTLGLFRTSEVTGDFYSFTYFAIWALPLIGLFLALRDRQRLLLDVSIGLTLVTLATNKPYLHMPRQSWDPILLGIFLIGVAAVLRRWLSSGERNGLTSDRLLLSDARQLAVLATASTALHATPQMPADTSQHANLTPGGGHSGGAGASGTF